MRTMAVTLILTFAACSFAAEAPKAEGLAPLDAAKAMTLPEGFNATLFAGEPDVHQPIAFAIDERGRLWVAENDAYPIWAEKGNDRILIFEDSDGDGRFDKRTLFYDKLNFVSAIEIGHGGVFVGSAPNLLFIADRNRDDKPDGPPEVLLDGWGHHDTHEMLNSFNWGPDGWLYGCHGVFTHSNVGRPGTPESERQPINGGVWRYHPITKKFEVFAHGTSNPWGVDFNDQGEAFITACVIPHLYHIIPGGRYQRQAGKHFNDYTYDDIKTIADHRHYVGEVADHAWWRGRNEPGGNDATQQAGGGHAHAGAMIYLGDNWPAEYRGSLFMNNVHGNRVNRDLLTRSGSGFTGSHGKDLMIANDQWYRGLSLKYGPDGGVYVIDWYDKQACHRRDAELWDRSNGRIYKLTHGTPDAVRVDLAKLSDEELVKLQLHPNDWYVRTARRILQERGGTPEIHAALRKILDENPEQSRKLRALWALHVTGGLDDAAALKLLDHEDEYVRGWTVRLMAEDGSTTGAAIAKLAAHGAKDDSAVVRRFIAAALQRLPLHNRWEIAEALASRSEDAGDHNIPLLVWYGVEPLVPTDPPRAMALAMNSKLPAVQQFIIRRAASELHSLPRVVATLGETDSLAMQQLILTQTLASLADRPKVQPPPTWDAVYEKLAASKDAAVRDNTVALAVKFGDSRVFPALRERLADRKTPQPQREQALSILATGRDTQLAPVLHKLLDEPPMRGPALKALAGYDHPGTPAAILKHYADLTADQKQDAISTLAARPSYALAMIEAIEKGMVPARDLPAFTVRQMLRFEDSAIAKAIEKHWGTIRQTSDDKAQQIAKWKTLLNDKYMATANPSNGRAIFNRTCIACHTLFGAGGQIGPDLTGSNRANLDYILENMVDPNGVIGRDYQLAVINMKDGRVISGMIRNETGTSLAIQTLNDRVVVGKDEVASTMLAPISMMPEGLLMTMQDSEARDLVAYLASPTQVPLPGELPQAISPPNASPDQAGRKPRTGREGEKLQVIGDVIGSVKPQEMGNFKTSKWSGNSHLWWTGGTPGSSIQLQFRVPRDGKYEVAAVLTKARDYGIVQLGLDGHNVGKPLDLYDANVVATAPVNLGTHELKQGPHVLNVTILGANPQALKRYMFALDYLQVKPN